MKALIGVLIFATIFGLILLVMICRFVYRIYVRLRNTKRAMEDALGGGREERGERRKEERGEKREERGWRREERGERREERDYYEEPRRTRTESGEVIIDRRHEERKQKKIFSQDDGEYVDYVES